VLIECLILREGMTTVPFKLHNYEFMPIPGTNEGEMGTSVCNIADQEAIDYLLGNEKRGMKPKASFRPYRPKQAQDDMYARRAEKEKVTGKFKGYSIEVLNIMGNDKGYVIKKDVKNEPMSFCGMNGKWTDDVQKIWPFTKIGDADTWLKSFLSGVSMDAPKVDGTPYHCGECELIFKDPIQLAEHWKNVHQKKAEIIPEDIAKTLPNVAEVKTYKEVPKGK